MPASVEARFRSRPNRFLIRTTLGHRNLEAFLPNPGRLRELLRPRVPLRLLRVPRGNRSTDYDVLAVRSIGEWVCLDTRLANRAVRAALRRGTLPEFAGYRTIRSEPRWGNGRFDFLLEEPHRCWLEVKTVSLVVDGVARFPDAPSARAARHLRDLARAVEAGDRAAVLFLVVRRARSFAPNDATDPAFSEALREASDEGVEVLARRASLRGTQLTVGRRLPTAL